MQERPGATGSTVGARMPLPTRVTRRAMTASLPAVTSLVVACGAQGIAQRKTAREVTVKWEPWQGNTTMVERAVPQAIRLFQERYPNVKTEIWLRKNEPGVSDVVERVTAFIAGVGPDIYEHCCANGYTFARQGFSVTLMCLTQVG
jgi:hypothetical protein